MELLNLAEETARCPCGRPLHYSQPFIRAFVESAIRAYGEFVTVQVGGRCWNVSRHYIALHGLRAADMERLGFEELPRP